MDLQKEREAFEKEMLNSRYVAGNISAFWDKKTQDYDIAITELRMAWHAWQAAKAIPDGFVVVLKEPTDAMLFAASGRDIVAEHYGDENIMWPELRETWKAMLEAAQEPAND